MNREQRRERRIAIADAVTRGRRRHLVAAQFGVSLQLVDAAVMEFAGARTGTLRDLRQRAVLSEMASLGVSLKSAAGLLGVDYSKLGALSRRLRVKFRHASKKTGPDARVVKMASMYRSGMTLEQIGRSFGLTRERVRQLLAKHMGFNHKDGGQSKKAEAKRATALARKDAAYLTRYGCTWEQYKEVREIGRQMIAEGRGVYQTPVRAWHSQKSNAKSRGIGWDLTFWQWWTIWQESGKWEQRGRAGDSYVMSRFRDQGIYTVGNVYIATLRENSADQPNNPYRTGHPDHRKVAKRLSANTGRRSVYHDLPRGVTIHKGSGRYVAQMTHNGKGHYLGMFSTPEEAHAAYLAARAKADAETFDVAEAA